MLTISRWYKILLQKVGARNIKSYNKQSIGRIVEVIKLFRKPMEKEVIYHAVHTDPA